MRWRARAMVAGLMALVCVALNPVARAGASPPSSPGLSRYQGAHPAAAVNQDGRPELFAVSSTGTLVHDWWSGAAWSGWSTLAVGPFTGSPSVVRNTGGTLEVFVRSTSGGIDHIWQAGASGARGWSTVAPVGTASPVVSDPAALIWPDGHAEVFAVAASGAVEHSYRLAGGTWSTWASLGGSIDGLPVAVALNQDGRPELFAVSSTGTLVHDWWSGAAWSGWFTLAVGPFTGSPSAVRNHSGTLEAFVDSTAGGIAHVWQVGANGGPGWSMAALIGAPGYNVLVDSPTALVWPDGHAQVFAVTPSGLVEDASRLPDGAWSDWTPLSPARQPLATAEPTVWLWPSGRPELAAPSTDGAMIHDWWDGAVWSGWFSLGGSFAEVPSGFPACEPSQLSVQAGIRGDAANSYVQVLIFTDHGGTCSLYGYPGLALFTASGAMFRTPVYHGGAYTFVTVPPRTVLVAPGGAASFAIGGPDYNVAANQPCPAAARLEIVPPGTSASLTINIEVAVCGGTIESPVVTGTAGPGNVP